MAFSWPDIQLSIAITAGILRANCAPTRPLDEGDRIIALEN